MYAARDKNRQRLVRGSSGGTGEAAPLSGHLRGAPASGNSLETQGDPSSGTGPSQNGTYLGGAIGSMNRAGGAAVNIFRFGWTGISTRQLVLTERNIEVVRERTARSNRIIKCCFRQKWSTTYFGGKIILRWSLRPALTWMIISLQFDFFFFSQNNLQVM